jgi:hypothetical protein
VETDLQTTALHEFDHLLQGWTTIFLTIAFSLMLPYILLGISFASFVISIFSILVLLVIFAIFILAQYLVNRRISRPVARVLGTLLISTAIWSLVQLVDAPTPASATQVIEYAVESAMVALGFHVSILVGQTFLCKARTRRDNRQYMAESFATDWIRILHLATHHVANWATPLLQEGLTSQLKDAATKIREGLPEKLASSRRRDERGRAKRTSQSIAAEISTLREKAFHEGGRREIIAASQSYIRASVAGSWLDLPGADHPPEQMERKPIIRPLIAGLIPVALVSLLHLSNVLQPAQETWGWLVSLTWLGISLMQLVDPTFEQRLSTLGGVLPFLTRKRKEESADD